MDKKSFWNFPRWTKIDQLYEEHHAPTLADCCRDSDTGCERIDKDTFILYGTEEGLLFKPKSFVWRMSMELYASMLRVLK